MRAQLVIVGATVRTMDPYQPIVEALAIAGDRIVAVGDDAEILKLTDRRTEVLDGSGLTVTPGLTDGHQHLLDGAEVIRGVDLDRVATLDEVRDRLSKAATAAAEGEWIRGCSLEYAAFGGVPYHHSMLDAVTEGHPMFVWALDLHTGFANAEALRLAGIDGPRSFSDASQVVCDADGRPTGELREFSATGLVLDAMPRPTRRERLHRAVDAMRAQNALGITAIHQMDADPETVDAFAELEAEGRLTLSVAVHNSVQPYTDPEHVDDLVGRGPRSGRRWRADGVKFLIDGVVETGTAWLEGHEPGTSGGSSFWPSIEAYAEHARRLAAAGYRLATHAIGDRAVREVLDVYASLPDSDRRHRIEHIETAPDTTVARFRPQAVTASMQPIHLRWIQADFSDPWSQQLTRDQCVHAMRTGDLSAAGALVVLGSDWPVAPYDPRLGFFAAQQRRSPDIDDPTPVGASRPLTAEETLAGYTVNAALAIGQQDEAGMLRPGMRADVVAWADDPVRCTPRDVLDLPVRLTVSAGDIVHRSAS